MEERSWTAVVSAAAGMKSGDSTWVESGYWDVTLTLNLPWQKRVDSKSRMQVAVNE